ncbi:uncharacterized protein PHA67_016148 isoform 2-T2 [Liasis olivaceus]
MAKCRTEGFVKSKECFICREGDEMGCDGLLHFCDCKNLFAHEKCLLTWIQKSLHNEDAPSCKICTAEYQLEKKSPWRILVTQWQQWIIFCTVLVLMISIPFLVYQMMIVFKDPPPGLLFNVAAICFGILTEILLTNIYCSVVDHLGLPYALETWNLSPKSNQEWPTGWPAKIAKHLEFFKH